MYGFLDVAAVYVLGCVVGLLALSIGYGKVKR